MIWQNVQIKIWRQYKNPLLLTTLIKVIIDTVDVNIVTNKKIHSYNFTSEKEIAVLLNALTALTVWIKLKWSNSPEIQNHI